MTRPRIVRADTLDLQDQHAPSAKDHSKQNIIVGNGFGPHQEQSIRHADQDTREEVMHGPGTEENHLAADEYRDGIDIYDDDDDLDDDLGHSQHVGGSEDGDLADGEGDDDLLDDDLMDKISSSPSIDDEDIDFEFVYALHNFVATVDGQANAAKGDTMVLLDDSNSYWWLVRIVKDGSIGYLPAEHIETPTERLARLNKHRNVDLSATMLGDNSEKSKNPLKKAMRRRNAKTVTFTSPTYIEASDIEFSTDDELDDVASLTDTDGLQGDVDDLQESEHEDIVVEPLRPKPQRDKASEDLETVHEVKESDRASPEKQRSSVELLESEAETAVSRSRNGTVRNTDSFFKDDTVETKKISLTPNLLRDEVGSSSVANEAREVGYTPISSAIGGVADNVSNRKTRGSMEAVEKALSAYDKNKDDKKRKDKKPGMLSGLFKRKDKKTKATEEETDEAEKVSGELSRSSPQPKTSSESVSSPESKSPNPLAVQKQASKLQKQSPVVQAPSRNGVEQERAAQRSLEANDDVNVVQSQRNEQTIRQVASEDDITQSPVSTNPQQDQSLSSPIRTSSPLKKLNTAQPTSGGTVASPTGPQYSQHSVTSPPQNFPPRQDVGYQGLRGDSPVEVSPVDISPVEDPSSPGAPGMTMDPSSPGGFSVSPVSPPLSPAVESNGSRNLDADRTSFDVGSTDTPTWSDASLRSYLDDESDIRDLFIIVHDNSNVPPAGPDHPITGSLFKEESKRLKEMNSQLDSMLSEWVGRKMRKSISQ
ncbi:hypothetical protein BDV37DRAFT_259225 [Aspergillus pseudonomiae]|uniref:SH3 domain-containing protein n=1 Tax=Aspergillus pseudonomiae TaxID=1506151 RepID=A0A5N7D1Y5_9EURO|nr:uncharacterized protein BDV37DRAFT_259225 [Aspergillus pseudonomiae]KAE8399838.1 hypothetical protein BDV37DRAFT_259225 [Aspergillus pseudonomiae]